MVFKVCSFKHAYQNPYLARESMSERSINTANANTDVLSESNFSKKKKKLKEERKVSACILLTYRPCTRNLDWD